MPAAAVDDTAIAVRCEACVRLTDGRHLEASDVFLSEFDDECCRAMR